MPFQLPEANMRPSGLNAKLKIECDGAATGGPSSFPPGDIPEDNLTVTATRSERPTVGAERDARYAALVSRQGRAKGATADDVPENERPIAVS